MKNIIQNIESILESASFGSECKEVVKSFTEKKSGESQRLETDGKVINGLWLGGSRIAEWKGGKIVFNDVGGNSGKEVQEMIKKEVPKDWIKEDEYNIDEMAKDDAARSLVWMDKINNDRTKNSDTESELFRFISSLSNIVSNYRKLKVAYSKLQEAEEVMTDELIIAMNELKKQRDKK